MNCNWLAFSEALAKAREPMASKGWYFRGHYFRKYNKRIYVAWTPCPKGRCLIYRTKRHIRTSSVREIPLGWLAEGRLWTLV